MSESSRVGRRMEGERTVESPEAGTRRGHSWWEETKRRWGESVTKVGFI